MVLPKNDEKFRWSAFLFVPLSPETVKTRHVEEKTISCMDLLAPLSAGNGLQGYEDSYGVG
jgi:hypothetical protein